MASKTLTSRAEIRRVGKFGVVGIINTFIDFAVYNVLSSAAGLTLVQSNIISTTVAMTFSFFANKRLVFKQTNGSMAQQAATFFIVTAFGLYVLQTGTIKLLTEIWMWPLGVALALVHWFGIQGHDQFVVKNGAKAAATVLSLTWNYVAYKKLVFK